MTNRADPDQLASEEAKAGYIKDQVNNTVQ